MEAEVMGGERWRGGRRERRGLLLSFLAVLLLFFAFLCSRSTALGFISPGQCLSNLSVALRLKAAEVFRLPLYQQRRSVIEGQPYYLETMTRLSGAGAALALGAAMSAAGAVYQCVFRNPIATPAMLGVSGGISLANLVLVLRYSNAVLAMTELRYLYGYGFSLGMLALVLVCARIMGRKRSSVTDILLCGAVVTRLVGHVVTTAQTYLMGEDDVLLFQEMNLYGTGIGNHRGALFLAGAMLAGLLPLVLLRFSLNAAAFPDEEARCMGVSAGVLRGIALAASTVLIVAAQIHCGDVALLALLVPHLCRRVFGAELRILLPSAALWGAGILLLCRSLTAVFAFYRVLSVISIGTIVNLLGTPLMIAVMVKHRRD